jgi:hypothetical protein
VNKILLIKLLALLILLVSQIYFVKVRIHERHRWDKFHICLHEFNTANKHNDLNGMTVALDKMNMEYNKALTNK